MKYLIIGGAGFIGSNLTKKILKEENRSKVVVFDNFSSGCIRNIDEVIKNGNLEVIQGDIKDKNLLINIMKGVDVVYHFASNPDISKAVIQPDIDFWEGTYLTNNILEAMRINNVKKLLYASGSGVYGDTGLQEVDENYSPLLPISTYGASKLSCEALICSYCHMFNINAVAFRFANVVGPNQTHGVGFDFIRRLMSNPEILKILGDGKQSKSYIYINDVLEAMKIIESKFLVGFSFYNVATLDYLSVNEIADIVTEIMGLKQVKYIYTGGDRGWKGDVPIVRLNSTKIRKLGWKSSYSSKEAIYNSVRSMYENLKTEN